LFMVHLLFFVIALTLFFWQEILLFVEQSLLRRGSP